MSALDNLNKGNGVLPASPITNGKEIPVKDFMLENGVSILSIDHSLGGLLTLSLKIGKCLQLWKR